MIAVKAGSSSKACMDVEGNKGQFQRCECFYTLLSP